MNSLIKDLILFALLLGGLIVFGMLLPKRDPDTMKCRAVVYRTYVPVDCKETTNENPNP